MKHVYHVHSYQSNFSVVCGVSGCPRTYNNFSLYKKHIYRVHRQDCNLGIGQPITLLPITDATDTEAICDIVQPLEESVDEKCGIIDATTGLSSSFRCCNRGIYITIAIQIIGNGEKYSKA